MDTRINLLCPHCNKGEGIVVYPRVPVLLYANYGRQLEAMVKEGTDACCIECYWQGTVGELGATLSIRGEGGVTLGRLQEVVKLVKRALRPYEDEEDQDR